MFENYKLFLCQFFDFRYSEYFYLSYSKLKLVFMSNKPIPQNNQTPRPMPVPNIQPPAKK